jgi:hypothetical protein
MYIVIGLLVFGVFAGGYAAFLFPLRLIFGEGITIVFLHKRKRLERVNVEGLSRTRQGLRLDVVLNLRNGKDIPLGVLGRAKESRIKMALSSGSRSIASERR